MEENAKEHIAVFDMPALSRFDQYNLLIKFMKKNKSK